MQETRVWFLGRKIPWRKAWQPTPVFLPGESPWQRSLVGYSPWGSKESDMTEWLSRVHIQYIFVSKESLSHQNLGCTWLNIGCYIPSEKDIKIKEDLPCKKWSNGGIKRNTTENVQEKMQNESLGSTTDNRLLNGLFSSDLKSVLTLLTKWTNYYANY